MKNKKVIWILIPAVLGLWGLIFFRVSKAVNNDEPKLFVKQERSKVQTIKKEVENYELTLDYDDPFLKGRRPIVRKARPKPTSPKKTKPVVKKTVKKLPLIWPKIEYMGTIGSEKGNKSMVILNVNGESWFMAPKEEKEELKLLKTYQDSIIVEYKKKEKRTIHKKG